MREIKFRAWDGLEMEYNILVGKFGAFYVNPSNNGLDPNDSSSINPHNTKYTGRYPLMQYTGHKTLKDRELYEGDIVFVEDTDDDKDVRHYLVIVWVHEWSMFASLHLFEYIKFIDMGYSALDESMFWTYTLQNSERDFHYAGNIYENPELIKV